MGLFKHELELLVARLEVTQLTLSAGKLRFNCLRSCLQAEDAS